MHASQAYNRKKKSCPRTRREEEKVKTPSLWSTEIGNTETSSCVQVPPLFDAVHEHTRQYERLEDRRELQCALQKKSSANEDKCTVFSLSATHRAFGRLGSCFESPAERDYVLARRIARFGQEGMKVKQFA
jgi:hypothetical protein